ncbi:MULTISPECIES: 16S rRNA (cytidine(1402)-2'-O)-methyltransferase [unclassified Thermotoga]|uniref:16S rRNA (cytidine(1402)-2'-O)-methyltransferase n=1 Tax=unclassified Thermotoga TaxID=2631113 RepID=UPI000541B081|nr:MULTISPECIES: 16S rRNA (cytidine(1402)-2'-O)-methyltransferase [unclassified Thermotoga]KAF2959812.1 rRNA methyltransferase [Thermotoga sp. 38H-to]KHC90277.1 uroporphyrin-III C/tetrapyrrole methyltransferase [Thermotoga sp. Mc24]
MGKLIIVGTPIGNLEDITIRALKTLREVDLILAEDTRRVVILLNKYRIKKPLLSFNERNSKKRIKEILPLLREGKKVALVSDAGMPVISDPGYNLIEECWREGIEVDIVPGPSALTSAVAASGFPGSKFIFEGFLPRGKNRRRLLKSLKKENRVIVFFESPERLLSTLRDILEIIGDREVFIAREMTKLHQEFFRGKVSEAISYFEKKKPLGEITVVLSGKE